MRVLKWLALAILAAALLIIAALFLADTGFGHRLIIGRLADMRPASGLRVKIGEVQGSIYGRLTAKDVTLIDTQGVFLTSPNLEIDWSPLYWWNNKLRIESLVAPSIALVRLPKFNPGKAGSAILPGFDIHIGRFQISSLTIAQGIAGPARDGRASGKVDIEDRRAKLVLDLDAREGDHMSLLLDAEPDRDRFDADAKITAPAGGVIGALLGTQHPVQADVIGDGSWSNWQGKAQIQVARKRIANLNLTARNGRYGVNGTLAPAPFLTGKVQRFVSPEVTISGEATFANRIVDGTMNARSPSLIVAADGRINLANGTFDSVLLNTQLIQPAALFSNMRGENMRLQTRLNGEFSRARYDYLFTAPRMAFDETGLEDVRASGQGIVSTAPQRIPIKVTTRRITGLGDVAGGLLNNVKIDGLLSATSRTLAGNGLSVRSDKLTGQLGLTVDLASGQYDVGLASLLQRYEIPGFGSVDVKSTLHAVPSSGGRGMRVFGQGNAVVRRMDNRFLRDLAGGLPVFETALERGADGILSFRGFRLNAPHLALTGNGVRTRDGRFIIDGQGNQKVYGPLVLSLKGQIERPQVTAQLTRPNAALGLSTVQLRMEPSSTGYAWTASGGSRGGPFTASGAVRLPRGAASTVEIAELNLSGVRGVGRLIPVTGGVDGELSIKGSGVEGVLEFGIVRGLQRIRANVNARNARLAGPPVMSATRADFDGDILLDPRGTTIDGTVTGEDLQYGSVTLERLAGNIKMTGGVGELRGNIAGSRGRPFDLQTVARFNPNRIEILASGSVDRRPLDLKAPAVLTREGAAWRLAPTTLDFAGGEARVAGLFGAASTELTGTVARMPMSILDMLRPSLGLGGIANGSFAFALPAKGQPTGKTDLTIRSLSRTGLILTSKPLDVGVTAILGGGKAGARLVALSDGKTLGRAQIQLSNISNTGTIETRLMDAPMFAQLRYAGAADTLWRLSGVENFDLSGDMAIGADITGRLNAPDIRGSLKTANARIESVASGLVLSNVHADGQFDGSRLNITSFNGKSGEDGQVSGSGVVEFAGAARGLDLTLQADRAPLLDRDDIAATVTGPIHIKSNGESGMISGDVVMDRSFFRLGQASAAQIPVLNVRESGPRFGADQVRSTGKPWQLEFRARAPKRLMVTGLGIDSEWQADLRIRGTIDSPAILGTADLVRGGYEFAGKRFELSRGSIRFEGASPPDPVLDILAVGDTQGINASIRVTGTGQRPEIAFSSVPALPQDEVLSRLLFGTSITNLSAPEAVQLASAVAALRNGGTGLNPINELRRAVGLDRLRILPADSATGQRTAVAAGKYLSRRTYVELITDGQGYTATRAEFQITRWLSILSTISTIGERSLRVRISKDY
jgi:translocation and assembly module TamB